MFPGPLPPDHRPAAAPSRKSPPADPSADPASLTPPVQPPTAAQLRSLLSVPSPPAKPAVALLLLVVSFALFLIVPSKNAIETTLMVVGVLIVHELGHYLGMLAFGYRDVKMLFIPCFGAAVSGRNDAAPAWQQAIIVLLGPLPGVAAGLMLLMIQQPEGGTFLHELATILVLLNAFNLLPLAPLDGGRLLEILLFSRHPVLATGFRLLATVGVAFIGLLGLFGDESVYILFAVFIFMTIPLLYRQTAAVTALRREHPDLPPDPSQLSDVQLESLIDVIQRTLLTPVPHEKYAERVRILHGRAITPAASLFQVAFFLVAYAAGIAMTVLFFRLVD